jgi:hypothetical protein
MYNYTLSLYIYQLYIKLTIVLHPHQCHPHLVVPAQDGIAAAVDACARVRRIKDVPNGVAEICYDMGCLNVKKNLGIGYYN